MSAIAPSEIHAELSRLWENLKTERKMRASLFNLVFYVPKGPRQNYMKNVARKVIEKFPSRVLFIAEDPPNLDKEIQARVSIMPTSEESAESVCELIELDVKTNLEERVPFILLPYLLADLPIYVVWAAAPNCESQLFQALSSWADRLIFDSEFTSDLSSFARTLLELHEKKGLPVADLNWARFASWRQLIGSTFYSPERLAELQNAKSVQILYNTKLSEEYIHTSTQALYLQGWLACQLEWKFQKQKGSQFTYLSQDNPIVIELYPEKQETLAPGAIISLDITTRKESHYSFGRDLTLPHQVSMRFSTLEKCAIPLKYIFAKAESGQSLVNEIGLKGTSEHFLRLLRHINEHAYASLG